MFTKKTALSTYDQASILRDDALTGFRSAHETLTRSNVLLAEDAEDQRIAAIAFRAQLQDAIQEAEERQAAARALAASNQDSIDLLGKLLGV